MPMIIISHSIDTALLKVHSDNTDALDEGAMTALIMLDLFTAVEVIDHPILLKLLGFGIKGNALSWVKSYLTDRTQCASVAEITSLDVGLHFVVPHGSG